MLSAGRLRHRIVIQKPLDTQDSFSGAIIRSWVDVDTVWAAIEPLSVRELIAAQSEDSKVSGKIIIRYRVDVSHEMRLYHASKGKYYNIEGVLSDKDSGLEYMTIPVSEGIRYQPGSDSLPVLLTAPIVGGVAQVGQVIESSEGSWANEPVSYSYQWYTQDDQEIDGADQDTFLLTVGQQGVDVYCKVTATNSKGSVSTNTLSFGPVLSA